jgi:hypothetical protein
MIVKTQTIMILAAVIEETEHRKEKGELRT